MLRDLAHEGFAVGSGHPIAGLDANVSIDARLKALLLLLVDVEGVHTY